MKKKICILLLATLFSFIISPFLYSDDFFAVKSKVISESQFKLGFLYFAPLLLLENVGYTSNIYTYDDRENPDWTGDLGLGLRASAIVANRLILQAEDLPIYSYYLNNKNLRAWSNRFAAAAYSYIGPLNLKAGYRAQRSAPAPATGVQPALPLQRPRMVGRSRFRPPFQPLPDRLRPLPANGLRCRPLRRRLQPGRAPRSSRKHLRSAPEPGRLHQHLALSEL